MISNNTIKTTATFLPAKGLSAIHLVQSSLFAMRLARLLIIGLFVSIAAMTWLPWQQSSRGNGQLIAYVPQEREQTIQAPLKGVVAMIAEGLVEGAEVKKDDFLLEIQPFAPNLVEQLNNQLGELKNQLDSGLAKAEAYRQNVIGFTEAGDFSVQAATEMVESAKAKLESKKELVSAYQAKELQTRLNYERQRSLFESGIKPQKEIEKLKQEWDSAKAELSSVQEEVESVRNEVASKLSELEEKRRLAQTKIDYAVAMEQDAIGSVAKIRKEVSELEVKLSEQGRLKILAPRDGRIFRMPVYERGQAIKEGESILTIVPDSTQPAVELFIPGNDMPLIQLGNEVRLQFEGWPAVQFAGWPSVAVGTFSGIVASIDATDNGKGQFRILVLPNEDDDISWPSNRYLRQGVRVNGWVMLRQVTLGYEMWRQLNGFPVIISDKEPSESKGSKPPKLPK